MEHVLIAEDTPELLELMQMVLVSEGYEVTATEDGNEILSLASARTPDLILLDVVMPGVSGFEVGAQLKAQAQTRDVPIIFVTARSNMDDLVQGLELAVDYIAKPFAVPELIARVRAALRIQRLQRELREKNEQLEQLAITDPLTGLLNRRGFDEQLQQELQRSLRNADHIGLAIFDLDHFKSVNDTYGHAQGDVVLKRFAEILSSCSRATDHVARLGGEEFALILPSTKPEGVITASEKIRQMVEETPIQLNGEFDGQTLQITCSGGAVVARYNQIKENTFRTADELLRGADKNLYEAKDNGRNEVICTEFLAESTPRFLR